MTSLVIFEMLSLLFLFACSAFFSSAETAMFSLDAIQVHRLHRSHPAAGRRIDHLLSVPTKLLSTLLIGNTLVNVGASALGYALISHFVTSYEEVISVGVMTFLLLILGEVAPKRLAMEHPERVATLYSPILSILIPLLRPVRILVEHVTNVFNRHFHPTSGMLTEDEFLTAVEVSEEEGVLDEDERTMVDGIIRLEDTQASDVMTPRVDLIGIDVDDPPPSYDDAVKHTSFRYMPLYRETMDSIEGLLDIYVYMLDPTRNAAAATIPPFYVPETTPLDTLLTTLQRERRKVAIVADEYGGTAGLITLGDLLEEIIDYVGDEHEEDKLTIEQTGPDRWMVDGSTSLEDINHELDLALEAEGADRIAGWVSAQAEKIPRTGEVIVAQHCRTTVLRVRKNRITLVLLEKLDQGPAKDEEQL
jgi:CBS domain containing-hemolysin-like protein